LLAVMESFHSGIVWWAPIKSFCNGERRNCRRRSNSSNLSGEASFCTEYSSIGVVVLVCSFLITSFDSECDLNSEYFYGSFLIAEFCRFVTSYWSDACTRNSTDSTT
jgi:hypothetical protein